MPPVVQDHDFIIPNKNNYFVATRATVWVQRRLSEGVFAPLVPLGNVNNTTLTPALEQLTHNTNFFGADAKDVEIVISKGANITCVIDEIVRHNLEFILASKGRIANTTFILPLTDVKTFSNPDTGLAEITINDGEAINSVLAVHPTVGEDEYEEGESADYTVDKANGVITLTEVSDINPGQKVVVYYNVEKAGSQYSIFSDLNITGRIKIVSAGTDIIGPRRFIDIPDANIRLEGDLPLLPKTEIQVATLNFSLNEDAKNDFGNWYNF